MKKTIISVGLSVVLVALAGCSALQRGSGDDLTGKIWVLTELTGNPLVAGSSITALFSADGKVGGSSGCNRYGGTFTVDLAEQIAARPSAVTAATKRCVNLGLRLGIQAGLAEEVEQRVKTGRGPDAIEGRAAFLEKRQPRFNQET